jgi:anti-sigma regulatory factor (Ser/Thr protein kinase)
MESGTRRPPDPGGQSPVALPVQERARPRPSEGTWRFTAPATEASVPQLRRTVRDLVRRQGDVPDDTLQNLLLILSELATNAVCHAALLSPEIGVEVELRGGWLRVAVEDSHPYRPKALAPDPDQEHIGGRGLLLVKTITLEAGGLCDVEQTGAGGKVIWAALPVPRTPALEFTSPLPRP